MGTKFVVIGSNLVVTYEEVDTEFFYSMINNLDSDLKFIFENRSKYLDFLDINIQITENIYNSRHKILTFFNNLAWVRITASKTTLDI